jgi:predicted transcriptional regulator
MDAMTCPHCRQPANRPVFFPYAQQQIFDYIWYNPGCSRIAIEKALYNNRQAQSLTYSYLRAIRASLIFTNYRLVGDTATGYRIETINAD